MRKITFAFIIPILLLVGCTSTPKEVVVTKVEYKYTPIPEAILKPCHVTEPPSQDKYINATDEVKLNLLTELIISLYGDIKACNDQVTSVRNYDRKQKELIEGVGDGK